jgi:peptidoglycan/LPS O-acetylase OafA/YrhL
MVAPMDLRPHAKRLQAMRGLAALLVALGHSFTTVPNGRIENSDFALHAGNFVLAAGEVIFQANTAVIFFYVLSGFVLRESLLRQQTGDMVRDCRIFAVRRLFRLFPTMWISIGAAIIVFAALPNGPIPGATAFFNALLGKNVFLTGVISDGVGLTYHLNPVLWSIQVELVMIACLPVMVALATTLTWRGNLAVAGLLAIGSITFWVPSPNAVRFAYCFYAGAALPELMASSRLRALTDGRMVVAALILLLPVDAAYSAGSLWMPYKFLIDTAVSVQLIAFVLLRPTRATALTWAPLVRLGDISYSFYAMALIVQIAVATALLRSFPPENDLGATLLTVAIAVAVVAISAALGSALFRWVEEPARKAGQDAALRQDRRHVGGNTGRTDAALHQFDG